MEDLSLVKIMCLPLLIALWGKLTGYPGFTSNASMCVISGFRLLTPLLRVRLGSTQKQVGGVVIPVEKIILHEEFTSLDYDISLLKVRNLRKYLDVI